MQSALAAEIRAALRTAAEPDRAAQMQAYMKSAMPFLGVRVPVARRLTRAAAGNHPFADRAELERTVRELWHEASYREERYAATALLDTRAARAVRSAALLDLCRELIVSGAWWDHADELAHRVGELLAGWPDEVRPEVRSWICSEDTWLRRVSIICQLGARGETDLGLLTEAIEANSTERDVFVRKAIGWALRDYARTDPVWVRRFLAEHELSPLCRREAQKHLA